MGSVTSAMEWYDWIPVVIILVLAIVGIIYMALSANENTDLENKKYLADMAFLFYGLAALAGLIAYLVRCFVVPRLGDLTEVQLSNLSGDQLETAQALKELKLNANKAKAKALFEKNKN